MNMFLLIAGEQYYPDAGTGNWLGCFSTATEAERQVEKIDHYFTGETRKHIVCDTEYKINNTTYDWYRIINLNEWIQQDGFL
jgi:hypothetical protein